MSTEKRGNGKTKKIIVGVATVVAVAAIAVPTALTLTNGKDNAGASNDGNNKYNIIVSTGVENVPDYSLSIEQGTKISTLKTLLKAIDGYSMEGIYKDEAMQHPYSDEDVISSSAKIYIKFVAITYTVNIYDEDGTTLVSTKEVSYKDSLPLTTPTKAEDNFATYEFEGWFNERNEKVDLSEITSNLNIHPQFKTVMKDYHIGFIYEAFKSSVSVTIGGEPVTLDSTYHYGSSIVVRATQPVGRDVTEFKVSVGGTTTDVLTELYRHEENGIVYYEIELTGNGDLSITYSEAASEYSLGNIPSQVTVKRNNKVLSSTDAIYYGDQLEISYTESEGHQKETFSVDGAELVGGVYVVKGNLTIEYTESRLAYTLGTIPSGVTVKSGDTVLSSNSTIYWGDELTFIYTEISTRLTGNTKQENGYSYSEKEIIISKLAVNGNEIVTGTKISVKSDIILSMSTNTSLIWEQGALVEYTLGDIPAGVTVTRGSETLTSGSKVYHGDTLTFTYSETSSRLTGNTKQENGYNYNERETTTYKLTVNGTEQSSGYTLTVASDVTLNITSTSSLSWEQGSRIEYSLGTIPSGVTVKRGNSTLTSNSTIYWGDVLKFTYTETSSRLTGNTKQENGYNYNERENIKYTLSVNGTERANGYTLIVESNVTLNITSSSSKTWEQGSRIEYSLGTIPAGVTVKRGSTTLSSNSIIYWGDSLTFTYSSSSTSYTGNTKQESGYNYREKETITYTLAVNGTNRSSGYSMSVTGNVTLKLNSSSSKTWEQAGRIEYSLGTIPSGVTVKRNGVVLYSSSTIYHGDVLTFTYNAQTKTATGNEKSEGGYLYLEYKNYNNTSLTVNGSTMNNNGTYTVSANVSIKLNSTLVSTAYEKTNRKTFQASICLGSSVVSLAQELGESILPIILRNGKALQWENITIGTTGTADSIDYIAEGDTIEIIYVEYAKNIHLSRPEINGDVVQPLGYETRDVNGYQVVYAYATYTISGSELHIQQW